MLERRATHIEAHPTASGALTRLAYARAKAARLGVETRLQEARLTVRQIEDVRARLTVRAQVSFLNLIAKDLDDDLLGFHLALDSDLREIGWLYYVTASSAILSDGLRRAARYTSIVNEGLSLRYRDNGSVGLTINYVGISRHLDLHQIEFIMTMLVRLCRQLTGLRLRPEHVKFVHRRDRPRSELLDFFGNGLEFGAVVDEATFATSVAETPITSADPFLNSLLISYFEEALAHGPRNRIDLRSTVENAIVPFLPHGKARANDVACRLGMSQRTLARNLAAEGLNFSGVLESLRRDLAQRYLAEKDLSISEIAWLLGYQEVSAFTHAFRRWTGCAPRQIRSRRCE